MAGHSKWASIKRKKAVNDSKRGAMFTKLGRAITVAAREGGGDPEANAALALAVQKAKDAAMPKDNIERAIAKGTGEGSEANVEAVIYEGYGPEGVALLIEALTDNRNRTSSDVRHLLTKHGGSLGEPGSVSYLFDKRGVVTVDTTHSEDDLMVAVDAGAEDIVAEDGSLEVVSDPSSLTAVRKVLEDSGVKVLGSELRQVPQTRVPLDEAGAGKLMKLIEVLEDNDDVDTVHANFDIPDDVLERVLGAE